MDVLLLCGDEKVEPEAGVPQTSLLHVPASGNLQEVVVQSSTSMVGRNREGGGSHISPVVRRIHAEGLRGYILESCMG